MITESKVTEIFCIADDFCKEFEVEMAKYSLVAGKAVIFAPAHNELSATGLLLSNS